MIKLNLETKTKEQELIKQYLEENVSEILAEKINNGVKIVKNNKTLINKKDLNGFMNYANQEARKLAAITMVAAGYAGDMPEDLCYDLLDDIDFHFNKVKCRKIEQMLPQLNKMVEEELKKMAL